MTRCACILAAGLGSRLGHGIPKGLLRLGEHTLIEESLQRLSRAGVERVVLVTGYRAELYAGLPVERVHNPDFASSGSGHSLALALPHLDDDFLLLESDLTYEQRALTLLQERADQALVSGLTGAGDEVWVSSANGRLTGLSKQRRDPVLGEFVGITRVSRERLRPSSGDYEEALYDLECRYVEDLLWAEIDDENHLRRAREIRARLPL